MSTTTKPSTETASLETRVARANLLRTWTLRVIIVAIFVGAWQLSITFGYADRLLVGDPAGTLRAFFAQFSTSLITVDLPYTLLEVVVGFVISVLSGFLVGIVLALNEHLRKAVAPLVTAANSLPRIALAPLFILWFGLGAVGKIALVVSFVFFVMLTTTIAAFTQPNGDFALLAKSLGVSTRQEILYFIFPAAVPTLLAGLELSLIYSFLGAVSGELVGGAHGLGVRLATYANNFHINKFLAILLLLVIISTVPVQLLRIFSTPFVRWHKAEMGQELQ